ncbi:MAG TPA: M28 family peptidase [Gemmatimonadaceae bacterium]|nr:M28 family peptidase [Gemmatimonadaceae bacterium]
MSKRFYSAVLAVLSSAVTVTTAAACAASFHGAAANTTSDSARVLADIDYLASDALEGRGTGTPGNDSAAAFAARRYGNLGLKPLSPGYLQPFEARSAMLAHAGGPAAVRTQNVVAFLPGTDAALRGQVIVVGAHIDHLGRSTAGALDPDARDAIRNGADDNASGSAAVLELARLFSARPVRRSMIFVNFSGEELGLLGSQYFVEHSPVAVDSIVAMLNFDMVGRMRGDSLIVYGVATASELPAILDSASRATRLHVRGIGDGFGPSDHSSFFARNIPVLHFFTNVHEDYHRATDDADKINAAGETRVIALAERIAREIDRRDGRLTFVRAAAPAAVSGSRAGSNVYFGSIPDMSAPDVPGLRLTGVRAGSPADSAGIRAGDVVVEFAGKVVSDLQTYSDALYSHQPGDEIDVVVLRNGERVTLRVKLGKRS